MPPKKRNISEVLESDDTEVSNKDLLLAIGRLTDRMGEFEASVAQMVDERVTGFERRIIDQFNAHKESLDNKVTLVEKRFDELETKLSADVKTVSDKVNCTTPDMLANSMSAAAELRIDQLERQVRMNELVISGVPMVENENLVELMDVICKTIKFSGGGTSIESCFRLPSRTSSRKRTSPSIMVKFWGADAKTDFYKQYFVSKRLCTSMIGFATESRIYVNENLTKRNFEIFRMARDMKNQGKISRYNTQRGRVVIQLLGSEQSHAIESASHLSSLIQQAPATTQSVNN